MHIDRRCKCGQVRLVPCIVAQCLALSTDQGRWFSERLAMEKELARLFRVGSKQSPSVACFQRKRSSELPGKSPDPNDSFRTDDIADVQVLIDTVALRIDCVPLGTNDTKWFCAPHLEFNDLAIAGIVEPLSK